VPPVYEAVGATVTYPTPPYPSTHNMGTNRMSEKARDGVVNKFGQSHDIKNLFVSDGSQFTYGAACNPTLTIVSLAIRQADHIAGAMQRRKSDRFTNETALSGTGQSRYHQKPGPKGRPPTLPIRPRQEWPRRCHETPAQPPADLGAIDQAGTPQQRREILDLAMMVEDFVMQRCEELREAHPLLGRDLFQRVPERHFQPDRGAMAAHPQRPGLRFVIALRLVREQMAHGGPPIGL
jgi:hypothetical protein